MLKPTGPYIPLVAASGNVANAAAVATLAAVASQRNYVTGFTITASGATAALVVDATLTGLQGGTLTYTFTAPAGVTAATTPLTIEFPLPIPAAAINGAVVLTLPALGSGNAHAAVCLYGYRQYDG